MNSFYKKSSCRLCGSADLENVLQLSPTPPGNHFVDSTRLDQSQEKFPLELDFCNSCKHVQLAHVVDPKILYQQNYSYVSGTSPVFVKYLEDYADYIVDKFNISSQGLVLDIGSNDGTALSFFQKKGFKVLGIDPAIEVVEGANARGIETICEFFDLEIAERYRPQYGKAQLINSHNACAHIDNLSGVIDGVKHWLDDNGLFVMEVGYFLDVYENAWFDTIYHEHLDYHTVGPLLPFFKKHGLEVIHVDRTSPQGGSIRVIVQHDEGPYRPDDSVKELINHESGMGLDRAETFHDFAGKILNIRDELARLLIELKNNGKTIAGFGAPTKATTLLSYFNLAHVLDFIVDENPLKQGLFTPGSHIPVYSAEAIYDNKPDYVLILAWNFADNIIARHQSYVESGGRFILPMPQPKIV